MTSFLFKENLTQHRVILQRYLDICNNSNIPARRLILIGGCSRAGKSTLAIGLKAAFMQGGFDVTVLPMDYWIRPHSARGTASKVMDRYRISEVVVATRSLLDGFPIALKPYDARTRELADDYITAIPSSPRDLVILEGVVALAVPELRELSNLKVFVHIPDGDRIKRLIRFYRDFKRLLRTEYKPLILSREHEEVAFVKSTAVFSDFVYMADNTRRSK